MEKSIWDSRVYRAVYNSYQELKALEEAPVSQKGAKAMEQAMRKFQKACEAYLEKREGAKTESGKERFEEIETLYKESMDKGYLLEMGQDAIDNREYDGMTWEDARLRKMDRQAMDRLETVIQEKRKEMAELEGQEISLETAMKMTKANHDLMESCREYQERESRVKLGGEKPKQIQEVLEGLEKRNLDSLRDVKKLREYEGKTWQEVKEVPIPRLEASGKEDKAGANSSIRLKLEKEGKKGFFTEAKEGYTDIGKVFDQYIKHVQDPVLKDKLLENRQVMVDFMEGKTISDVISGDGLRLSRGIEIARQQFTGDKEKLKKDGKLMRCFGEMLIECKQMSMADGNVEIEQGDKVTLRNVATSRMADLLGIERLIAHSEIVEVKVGDRVVKGSFMDFAEGYDANSTDIDVVQKLKEVQAWDSPEMLRDTHDLEIFDLICGQNDRHGGNAFYKVGEMGPDGTRPAIGIMGIDNDLSFGTKVGLDKDGKLESVGRTEATQYINFISEDLADKIMSLNREKLEYAVGDIITKEQLDALELRTEKMKELIQTQMFKVKEDGWNLDQYSKDDPSPEAQRYRKAAESAKYRVNPAGKYPWSVNMAGAGMHTAENSRKKVEDEKKAYQDSLEGIEGMFDEAEKDAAVQYEQDKVEYAQRMKEEQKKEDQRERRGYMTQMEGAKNLFESAEKERAGSDGKEKTDKEKQAKENADKKKKDWTFASKASQKERKTDISISSRKRIVR